MPDLKQIAAIIVAAGKGERMGGMPKQYRPLAGKPVLAHSIEAFRSAGLSDIFLVIHPEHRNEYALLLSTLDVTLVNGGKRRQDSVKLALEAVKRTSDATHVMIHDAARPGLSASLVSRLADALAEGDAVIPVLPVADTLKRLDETNIVLTESREGLALAQTPQAFHLNSILAAHLALAEEDFTDDASLIEAQGRLVATVPGDPRNSKLTTEADWHRMGQEMQRPRRIATGSGLDVHRLLPHDADVPAEQQTIRIGGLDIPHTHYLEGFSDADVALHAATDAILGALGLGDIGQHFPPGDARWKGADSALFIEETRLALLERSAILEHLDLTIICESPKIGPHRNAMRTRLAELLHVEESRINIKATTTEGLGFTGRGEGVMAQAVATVSY